MFGSATARVKAAVRAFALGFDADTLDVATAKQMVREWAAIENSAATIKALAAARVASAGQWDRADGKSAADWLAGETGTTGPKARDQIETGKRLGSLEETAGAAKRGELSPEQTAAIADAASADPSAEAGLLGTAKHGSLRDLRDRCASTKARADADPEATRRRIHAGRRLRDWTDKEGVAHLHANGPVDLIARVKVALGPLADRFFQRARREGRHEDPAAYAFDALVALADEATGGSAWPAEENDVAEPTADAQPDDGDVAALGEDGPVDGGEQSGPDAGDGIGVAGRQPVRRGSPPMRFRAVIRVDYEALIRGWVEGDETCEIAGLGPVSVSAARDLLGESTMHLVITKGTDVANVTYLGRSANAAQQIALLWQMPMCIVEGCCRRGRLENDHGTPFAECHETRLANLRPKCDHHHFLKTHRGWDLVEGEGRRPMVPPDHPDHPKNRRSPEPAEGDAA